jgi:DNA-binding transcriptional ArsR family regulator
VSIRELGVVEENDARRGLQDNGEDRLVALGRALSDPIRGRMLSMMAEGRSCCDFSDSGVAASEGRRGSASASSRTSLAWASRRSPTT